MKINIILGNPFVSGGARNVIALGRELSHRHDVSILILQDGGNINWVDTWNCNVLEWGYRKVPLEADVNIATSFSTWDYLGAWETNGARLGYLQGREIDFFPEGSDMRSYASTCFSKDLDIEPIAIASHLAKWIEKDYGYTDVPVINQFVYTKDFYPEPWFPSRGVPRVAIVGQYNREANEAKDKDFAAFKALGTLNIEIFHVTPSKSLFANRAYAHWVNPRTPWLRRIYSSCDFAIVASKFEGVPVIDWEMWACGTPLMRILGSGMGDEFLVDGYNCILVEYGDSASATYNAQLLHGDAELRRILALNGQETVIRAPSVSEVAGRWEEIMESRI